MTERCQTKFTEKIGNRNYIICGGIVVALLAILITYRFHLSTIIVSYGLGCMACYYCLSSNYLEKFFEQLVCHFIKKLPEENEINDPLDGCHTCGSDSCNRHDPEISPEPWVNLQIHKQLDQAIEDFYNAILEQFISTWYNKITLQPFFVDELRYQLRYASASLLRRALKIDYHNLIFNRLVPCALRHYTVCTAGVQQHIHIAASNRNAELKYLRCVTDAILPYLLRTSEVQNSVFRILIREIFAGWVLLSLTDILADPHIINTLIVLATGDEKMADLPATPDYNVEFLENFVRQSESVYCARSKLLRIDLELLLNNQDHFYALLHYLKTTTDIYLLQFYKDIKSFQTRILNPEPTEEERKALKEEAQALLLRLQSPRLVPAAILLELRRDLAENKDCVQRLQTSRALYQAARQSHAALEKTMLPKFLHSEEFYELYIGPRIPTGYQKQMTKRPQDKQNMLKLGLKLKSAIKSQDTDGQILDTLDGDLEETESIENMDILKYLDSLAADDSTQDLSTYKVVLTNVECRLQAPPRRGPIRVFTLTVHRVRAGLPPSLWSLERSEHDFHLLRSKLLEFHGEMLADLPLPSRRDNSPLETLRYKYEDFVQRLLHISLLQTSELLHLFLTVDGDFTALVQASTLASGPDLGNIYQSVALRLRKEKGQHLDAFLRNFLVSSDKERYQALKQGTNRDVEEAHEVDENETEQSAPARRSRARTIQSSLFLNNFDAEPALAAPAFEYQTAVVGLAQCVMYTLIKILKVPTLLHSVAGSLLGAAQAAAAGAVRARLRGALCQRRLAYLIGLGHGIIFNKQPPSSQSSPSALQQRTRARRRVPLAAAHELLQCPQLNKQLVYNLLDLCILELFPELHIQNVNGRNKSKS